MDIQMQKAANGILVPSDEEAQQELSKLKLGQPVRVTIVRQRNYTFLKKWFALINFAFDYFETPALNYSPKMQGLLDAAKITPEKSLDRFRKDVTILAGYYDATYRLNGEVRIEAKSISFASMNEEDFEKMYSKTIDVVIRHVLPEYTESELRKQIEDVILGFV